MTKLNPTLVTIAKTFTLTLIAFAFTFLASLLSETQIFRFIFPEASALEDFDYTDYVFKTLPPSDPASEVILINIGNLTRRGIAEQLRIISKYKPKVIGIDAFFDCRTVMRDTFNCPQLSDTLGNRMLKDAIKDAGNVVLVTMPLKTKYSDGENIFDSLRQSDQVFRQYAYGEGFPGLNAVPAANGDAKTCRTFNPKVLINDTLHFAFAVQIARAYDSVKTSKFLQRNNSIEVINYRGNIFDDFRDTDYHQKFYTLDVSDVFTENFVPEIIEGRIVVLGYMGEPLGSDPGFGYKFYTPLNPKMTGKSIPDMFRVVIYANIAQMIVKEDWVESMSQLGEFVFAFFATFIHILILVTILQRFPGWFDLIAILLVLLQLLFYAYLRIFSFQLFGFKIQLIATLGCLTVASVVVSIFNTHASGILSRLLIPKSKEVVFEQD